MRKCFFAVVIVFLSISLSYAGKVRENIGGCGLGSKYLGDRDEEVAFFYATTTNNSSSRPSSITSGTSECKQWKGLVLNEKVDRFISDNMANLSQDISRGEGEYLETLAVLMNIDENEKHLFSNKLQKNFNSIYGKPDITSQEVAQNIKNIING